MLRVDDLRKKLDEAKTPPDRLGATRKLQMELLVALENAGNEAAARIKRGSPKPDDKSRISHCNTRTLVALLQDPEINRHFTSHEGDDERKWGVLTRISDRCLHGSKGHGKGPAENEFLAADFGFIDSPELSLEFLSQSARLYIVNLRRDPVMMADAIRFLNEVLETARSGLIDLGGVSLTELFLEIRRNLLEDCRELVLLVEDFAVLAGIQGPLLDVMIREGIRDGKQELCVMRTALAVTEGRLSDETVRTRAQARWKIESKPFASEEEALERFQNFVGGYLNAARWGVSRLGEMFKRRSDRGDSTAWIECFFEMHQDDMAEPEKQQLLAFGRCPRAGHPLFPFNPGAIRQLARQYLYDRPNNIYRFDPRLLINRLLISTIRDNRVLWEKGEFPPVDFSDFRANLLGPEVSLQARAMLGELEIRRAAPLIYFWGDDPRSTGEAASMAAGIYDAFSVPQVPWGVKPVARLPEKVPAANQGGSSGATAGSSTKKDRNDLWAEALDDWRINGVLTQTPAKNLRNYLSEAVSSWIDANALFIDDVKSISDKIYLPKAMQSNPDLEKAVVVAATEEEFNDDVAGPRFITAIKAVVRYHERKNWDYEGGETDYARYTNFIAKLAAQAAQHLVRKGSLLDREGIKPVAQALLIGARILNLPGASANTDADNLAAMLAEAPPDPFMAGDPQTPWQKLKFGAYRNRNELRSALLSLVSARQGSGAKIYALDSLPLLEAVAALRSSKWDLEEDPVKYFQLPSPGLKEHCRNLRKPETVIRRGEELGRWAEQVTRALGKGFDASELVANLRATVEEAADAGVFRFRDRRPSELLPRIKDRTSLGSICPQLKEAVRLQENAARFDIVLSCVSVMDDELIEKVSLLIKDYEVFLAETEATVAEKLKDVPSDLDETTAGLRTDLEALAAAWENMNQNS